MINCASKKTIESPTIYISNLSYKPIHNIRCDFPSGDSLTLKILNPGSSRSQAFNLKKTEDFFGNIQISWKNDDGILLNREFYLMHKNLPSIDDHQSFNYLEFFLEQEDMEVVSSDAPDLAAKSKRMDLILKQLASNFNNNKSSQTDYSLIRIVPKTSEPIPDWMQYRD